MEVSYKKDINHTYILFQGEKINTETFQVQMALHNLVEGLLPSSILSIDQEDIWRCECTGLISLKEYCEIRELKKEEFVWIVNQLMENIQEAQDFLLDVNSIYLMPGEIYIHMPKRRILCCMIPFYQNDIWNSLKQTLQFLLQHLDSEDQEGAAIAYNFFRILSREDCSMELLWSVLYEKNRKWKKSRDFMIGNEREKNTVFGYSEESNKKQNVFGAENSKKQNAFEAEGLKKQNAFGAEGLKKQNAFGAEGLKKQNTFETEGLKKQNAFEAELLKKNNRSGAKTLKKNNKNFEASDEEVDALLDELFFQKENDKKYFWQDALSLEFIKQIAYLFPCLLAIVIFVYLVFHSWTMSGVRLASFAVVIVILQAIGLVLYFVWGRETKEINPLLEEQEEAFAFQGFASDSWMEEEGTAFLDFVPKAKARLIRMDTNETYELKEKEILIGKNKERVKILIQEPTVSRVHALLTKKDGGYYMQDMNSKNGTFVNGERLPIRKEVLLKDQDEIHLANICFHFQL